MRTITVGLIGIVGAACTPSIKSFHVQPETYCPSTSIVRIIWNASGDTTVTVAPSGKTFHNSAGNEGVRAQPMTVSIEAFRHHRKAGKPPHNVVPMPASRPLVAQAGIECDEKLAKTPIIPIGPDEYDPKSHVSSIKNECVSSDPADPCPVITVCHGSDDKHVCAASWQVAPGATVPLVGVTMTGSWQLARPLRPGESCGAAAGSGQGAPVSAGPPPGRHMTHLKVQLGLVCT